MDDARGLKELQLDALREVANIGAGHAATALSQMTNRTIMIAVPEVNVRALEDVTDLVGRGDEVMAARRTDGQREVLLSTKQGMIIRFPEDEVRPMGRTAAGVRGIDESELKSASFNQAQLDAMVANRADAAGSAAYAGAHGWQATTVAWDAEAKPKKDDKPSAKSASSGSSTLQSLGGMMGSLGQKASSILGAASKVAPSTSRVTMAPTNGRSSNQSPTASGNGAALRSTPTGT